jgi:hypothetical protein
VGGDLYAVSLDGHLLWDFPTPALNMTGVALANGVAYFQSLDGYLYALDERAADAASALLTRLYTGGNLSGPAVSNGHLYEGTAAGDGLAFLLGQTSPTGSIIAVAAASPAPTTTVIRSSADSAVYGQGVTFTATVSPEPPGGGTPGGTVTFTIDGVPQPAVALSGGEAALTAAALGAGSHTVTAAYGGDSQFAASSAPAFVQAVAPAPLTVTANDATRAFGQANPAFTARYSGFVNGDGPGSLGGTLSFSTAATADSPPGSYAITPGGLTSANYSITFASGTLTVTPAGAPVQPGQAAGIGFWHNQNGQALINSFNGGPNATALANWLATTFPDLYGANAGSHNLTGHTNAQVAAFYETLFGQHGGPPLDAQVLATALNVYATTLSLGGTAAQAYGFTVSADGLGAATENVGGNGAAFGLADNTTLDVYQLLLAADQRATGGVLYNGDHALVAMAVSVFGDINDRGGL